MEYFGKKGMYLFGFIIVSHYLVNENVDQGGLQYEFVDVVVEGYSGQDNIQVVLILHFFLVHVIENYTLVNVMFMHSDDATCFSSQ